MSEHSAEKDALVAVILEHGLSGFVSTREKWVGCLCGAKLAVSGLSPDGYAESEEEDRVRAEHLADAILTQPIPPGGAE